MYYKNMGNYRFSIKRPSKYAGYECVYFILASFLWSAGIMLLVFFGFVPFFVVYCLNIWLLSVANSRHPATAFSLCNFEKLTMPITCVLVE